MGFAIGGAALAGALISSNASSNAADTQANAANNASNAMTNQNNLSRQDMAPWLNSGRQGLNQLNQQMPDLTRNFSMADFRQDPGYQFNLQQGQQAIERSAAARGGIGGGASDKALMDYSQGLAGNQYQNAFNNFNTNQSNRFNRLATVAGYGQQAATQNSQNGMTTAANIGQNMMGAGNAQAAGQVAGANSINSAIGTGTNSWMQTQMLNRLAPQQQQPGGFNMTNNYSPGSQYGVTSNPNSGVDYFHGSNPYGG